jgi:DNA recombination protein RmuC
MSPETGGNIMNGLLPVIIIIALLAAIVIIQIVLLVRRASVDLNPVQQDLHSAQQSYERTERSIREEIARNREEAARAFQQSREELSGALKGVGDTLFTQFGALTQTTDRKLDALRETVEQRLETIQQDNAKQLDRMRETVDERLQSTLDKRLSESFKQVGERLEQVSRGLGEMQSLATGVGDLKKVLTNVKTRGTWGEVQLGAMLEQVLTPDQYAANVAVKEGGERVEFAIRLPGRSEDGQEIVWLPVDAKFPMEDYQRLVDAQERADADSAEAAAKQLEARIKQCAGEICGKYLSPPNTTDFGILFLPTEGLFAEAIRRTGLTEYIQRECRVVIAGPTTLWALLNSLQMGFRTLAIQKRSGEVWNLLSAVKTEWMKYGDILAKAQKKIREASDTLEQAQTRTRAIGRKLKDVEELPSAEAGAPPVEDGGQSGVETDEIGGPDLSRNGD